MSTEGLLSPRCSRSSCSSTDDADNSNNNNEAGARTIGEAGAPTPQFDWADFVIAGSDHGGEAGVDLVLVAEPAALERLLAASRLDGASGEGSGDGDSGGNKGSGGGNEGSGGGDEGSGGGGEGRGGGLCCGGGGLGCLGGPRLPLIAVMALVAISEAELGDLDDADRGAELTALTLAVQHSTTQPSPSP